VKLAGGGCFKEIEIIDGKSCCENIDQARVKIM